MRSHTGRLYVVAATLLVFFVMWATVAANPWDRAKIDPRLAALQAREAQVKAEVARANRISKARWVRYKRELKRRNALLHKRKIEEDRAMAIARSRRRVVYRTVIAGSSRSGSGARSYSGGGGGSSASSAGGGGGGAGAPVAVSVGTSPVASSGTS